MFGVDRGIQIIPNFVNDQIYVRRKDPEFRSKYARPSEKLVVHISNFRPVKRILDCVRVFSRLATNVPSRLLMIGDGPDRDAAQALAVELGVASLVRFVGERSDVASLLGVSDLLLLPSEMESFGLAALEAMACGAIPIATRVGGLPEVVTDGLDGYLVDVGDIDQMAPRRRIRFSISRPGSANCGRPVAIRLSQDSGSDSVIGIYLSLYERILEGDCIEE